MSTPCPCWQRNSALGHEGHCCFQSDGRWRSDADICHAPTPPTPAPRREAR